MEFLDEDGDIYVELSPDEQIHISYYENSEESYAITRGSTLTFEKQIRQLWYRLFRIDLYRPSACISLPAGYQGDLTVTTKNGTIHLQGISAAHCLAQSANGSLELKNLALQSLSAGTDNGGLRLSGITAGSVEAETANGSIWLETLTADTVTVSSKRGGLQMADVDAAVLQGETALGEVSFEKLRISQRLELSSHAGNVSGSLYGEQQDFTISARTSLGNCDLPQQTTGGACSLRLSTNLGDISVRFLGK